MALVLAPFVKRAQSGTLYSMIKCRLLAGYFSSFADLFLFVQHIAMPFMSFLTGRRM